MWRVMQRGVCEGYSPVSLWGSLPFYDCAERIESETALLKSAKYNSFAEEINVLSKGQAVRPNIV